jgi:hypothetical protein
MAFRAKYKFTDWLVRPRKVYVPQLGFGPYTFLSLTNQSVNLHIALKAMFYLLITWYRQDAIFPHESYMFSKCQYNLNTTVVSLIDLHSHLVVCSFTFDARLKLLSHQNIMHNIQLVMYEKWTVADISIENKHNAFNHTCKLFLIYVYSLNFTIISNIQ